MILLIFCIYYINYIVDNLHNRVMIIKKTENTPMYNEQFTIRAYDNVEYVERLRNSRIVSYSPVFLWIDMKFGMMCVEFFFSVPGIG